MESVWEIADKRMSFARNSAGSSRRFSKQIDLLIRSSASGEKAHLLELKVVDGRYDWQTPLDSIDADFKALETMTWRETRSAWCVALAHSFGSRSDVLERFERLDCWDRSTVDPVVAKVRAGPGCPASWVVGLRAL
jgi:hypothetical protein